MINQSNYFSQVEKIGLANLPLPLQKMHDIIIRATENNTNWERAFSRDELKRIIQLQFDTVAKVAAKLKAETAPAPKEEAKLFSNLAEFKRLPKGTTLIFHHQRTHVVGHRTDGTAIFAPGEPQTRVLEVVQTTQFGFKTPEGKISYLQFPKAKEAHFPKPGVMEIEDENGIWGIYYIPSVFEKEPKEQPKHTSFSVDKEVNGHALKVLVNHPGFYKVVLVDMSEEKIVNRIGILAKERGLSTSEKPFTGSDGSGLNVFITDSGTAIASIAIYDDVVMTSHNNIEKDGSKAIIDLTLKLIEVASKPLPKNKDVEKIIELANKSAAPKEPKPKKEPKAKKEKAPKAEKPKKEAKPKKAAEPTGEQVRHYSQEISLLRRTTGLDGKKLTKKQFINLTRAFEKAVATGKISKKSKLGSLIVELQTAFKNWIDKIAESGLDSIDFTLNGELGKRVKDAAGEQVLYASVPLLVRYINMMGDQPDPDKVERLRKAIDNALANEKVDRKDPYYKHLIEVKHTLKSYTQDKNKPLQLKPATLQGLAGIPELSGK